MKGLILTNAYTDIPSVSYQVKRLTEEFNLLGIQIDACKNDFFAAYIKGADIVNTLIGYDFCIYLDKDKYISEMLEKSGLKIFNSYSAITLSDDKMQTHIALSDAGIKMPLTLSGLLCYQNDLTPSEKTVLHIEKTLGYPLVIKNCFGSSGKFVYKITNRAELSKKMTELIRSPHLYQQFIKSSEGRDVRVIVIGGKAVACMLRKSDKDFRSNIELGGTGYEMELPQSFKDTAEKAARVLKLDYCGVDLLFGENGEPVFCEINSNAFFGGIEKVTNINIAAIYAKHILNIINK